MPLTSASATVPIVLAIGGSDPDGCAGIAADLRAFYSLGVHGCFVITAATVQNTKKFDSAFAISPETISRQIDSVFSDMHVDAVKIGLIVGEGNVKAVADGLRKWKARNIVLDPVMSAQPGGRGIVEKRTADAIRKYLVPLATVITPNADEAFALTGAHESRKAALALRKMGARNVVVKGLRHGSKITDYAFLGHKPVLFTKPLAKTSTHGGGCIFSSALAANLAKGRNAAEAVAFAELFIQSSIANAWKPGKGIAAVEPLGSAEQRKVRAELVEALAHFESAPVAYKLIPEIGTNIVYALSNAKSAAEVAGVVGRLRACGSSARSVGVVDFGASSHVARMLLEFTKKFKQARAAINIANNSELLHACKKIGLRLVLAEREREPVKISREEGKSLQWLVGETLKRERAMPDGILFTGAVGKEPSIVLFGRTPAEVVRKAIKVADAID
ncbi:MAG: bifunctional hydroxymethylpyrimidine kinase/phosphomethylpyrimidine kinase [Candidatus Burarchaeum sp.]|nr:bifunctional hydroxymethylpyrimidine kinase/phosphomethylpyrimidine kinase [Candidatus Burarchaeum sp.]MDO8340257.1 bifunctional hydroxymethylpyrimidine kinase/phosphomethylpyrimidine kinase [Candidatus Burarchaeum sp.]